MGAGQPRADRQDPDRADLRGDPPARACVTDRRRRSPRPRPSRCPTPTSSRGPPASATWATGGSILPRVRWHRDGVRDRPARRRRARGHRRAGHRCRSVDHGQCDRRDVEHRAQRCRPSWPTVVRAKELVDLDPLLVEGELRGHPWIVANKGRIGFDVDDLERFAPEAQQPMRLPLVGRRTPTVADVGTVDGLDHRPTCWSEQLGDDGLDRAARPRRGRRARPRHRGLHARCTRGSGRTGSSRCTPATWPAVASSTSGRGRPALPAPAVDPDPGRRGPSRAALPQAAGVDPEHVGVPGPAPGADAGRARAHRVVPAAWSAATRSCAETGLVLLGEVASRERRPPRLRGASPGCPTSTPSCWVRSGVSRCRPTSAGRAGRHPRRADAPRPVGQLLRGGARSPAAASTSATGSTACTRSRSRRWSTCSTGSAPRSRPTRQNCLLVLRDHVPVRLVVKDFVDDAMISAEPLPELASLPADGAASAGRRPRGAAAGAVDPGRAAGVRPPLRVARSSTRTSATPRRRSGPRPSGALRATRTGSRTSSGTASRCSTSRPRRS